MDILTRVSMKQSIPHEVNESCFQAEDGAGIPAKKPRAKPKVQEDVDVAALAATNQV